VVRIAAALYIDPRGPYPKMPGVDCWDEQRDARLYDGPHPVVAHPPCGPWGKLAHMCKHQPRELALIAVEQVRQWGGVLEHPAESKLWGASGLPEPGEIDAWGGFTLVVNQCEWGHVARKPTRIYCVGIPLEAIAPQPFPGREPTHAVCNGRGQRLKDGTQRKRCTAAETRMTPPLFAEWLVALARAAAPFPGREPTHWASGSRTNKGGGSVPPGIKVCSAQQRRRTPPLFAEWLVSLARSVR
jgi:hypothetical protein